MRLFLLRHAHTQKVVKGMSDFERRIDERGEKQLEGLSSYLEKKYSDVVLQVCCSPATRTKSTLASIINSISSTDISYDHELYLPSKDNLLHYLWRINQSSENVMVVSHNNGISDLATYLLGEVISLPTCGLIVIDFDDIKNIEEISAGIGVEYDYFFE